MLAWNLLYNQRRRLTTNLLHRKLNWCISAIMTIGSISIFCVGPRLLYYCNTLVSLVKCSNLYAVKIISIVEGEWNIYFWFRYNFIYFLEYTHQLGLNIQKSEHRKKKKVFWLVLKHSSANFYLKSIVHLSVPFSKLHSFHSYFAFHSFCSKKKDANFSLWAVIVFYYPICKYWRDKPKTKDN